MRFVYEFTRENYGWERRGRESPRDNVWVQPLRPSPRLFNPFDYHRARNLEIDRADVSAAN